MNKQLIVPHRALSTAVPRHGHGTSDKSTPPLTDEKPDRVHGNATLPSLELNHAIAWSSASTACCSTLPAEEKSALVQNP